MDRKINRVVRYIKSISRIDNIRLFVAIGDKAYVRAMVHGYCDGAFERNPIPLSTQFRLCDFAVECCLTEKSKILDKKFE